MSRGVGIYISGAGPSGLPGPPGAPGTGVINGNGAPSDGLGVIGDYYIDNTGGPAIYGPKSNAGWGSATVLKGAKGDTGAQGNGWIIGTGVPSSGTGNNGDMYLNVPTYDSYGPKTAGSWGSPTSLIGPAGGSGSNFSGMTAGNLAVATDNINGTSTANIKISADTNGITIQPTTDSAQAASVLDSFGNPYITNDTSVGVSTFGWNTSLMDYVMKLGYQTLGAFTGVAAVIQANLFAFGDSVDTPTSFIIYEPNKAGVGEINFSNVNEIFTDVDGNAFMQINCNSDADTLALYGPNNPVKFSVTDQDHVNLILADTSNKLVTVSNVNVTGEFLSSSIIYGNGSDSNVTIASTDTTLVRDMFYDNLTITNSHIKTAGFRLFVRNVLSMDSGSSITNNGVDGVDGGANAPTGTVGGGTNSPIGLGLGGAGGGNTTPTLPGVTDGFVNGYMNAFYSAPCIFSGRTLTGQILYGGTAGVGPEFNGGAGGICYVAAYNITTSSVISAVGGAGLVPNTSGGGGGGCVIVITSSLSTWPTVSAAGGASGGGTGPSGSSGYTYIIHA